MLHGSIAKIHFLTTSLQNKSLIKRRVKKMQDMIQFLINNLDVLIKVKEGTASLIGVSPEELKAILEVFSDDQIAPKAYYWM